MDKIITAIKKRTRLLVQVMFTAFTNGYITGFRKGSIYKGQLKYVCVPGLNCYSCPSAYGSCPLGALQSVLASRYYSFSFYVIGFMLILGALAGRFVCGFFCPFGLIQDLLNKIPFPKKLRKLPFERVLRLIKYGILIEFVILIPSLALDILGRGSPGFCKYICPSGTLFASLPLLIMNSALRDTLGNLFALKITILALICFASVIIYRPFCRYLCPLGAIYGLFNPIALFRYKIDTKKCNGCKKCQSTCKLDIPVYKTPNSTECIRCGNCKSACPSNAIIKTPSFNIKPKGKDNNSIHNP